MVIRFIIFLFQFHHGINWNLFLGVTDLYSEEDEEEEIGPETSPTSATPAPRFLKEYEIETSNPAPASSTNISTLMELDPSFHANIPNGLCELFKTMICDETKADTTHCANIIYDDEVYITINNHIMKTPVLVV